MTARANGAGSGFGRFITEQSDAERKKTHGYRRGFGKHLDQDHAARAEKASQMAALRRERIKLTIFNNTARFDPSGQLIDPLENEQQRESAWRDRYGSASSEGD